MTIGGSGVITWTPGRDAEPGTNTVTTMVTNNNAYDMVSPQLTATNSFTVIVREVNRAPGCAIATADGQRADPPDGDQCGGRAQHPFGDDGLRAGQSACRDGHQRHGVFTWTPGQTQSPGTNTVTTMVTNNNAYDTVSPQLTATNSFTVIVREVNQAPALGVIAPQTVNELTPLTVTNAAGEPNIHSATVGYGLINPPAGMTIEQRRGDSPGRRPRRRARARTRSRRW